MRKYLFVFFLLVSVQMQLLAESALVLTARAQDAFDNSKWKSAATLYDLLLKDSLNYTPLFANALIADVKCQDAAKGRFILTRFEGAETQLFKDIRRKAIALRQFDIYEDVLLFVAQQKPALKDSVELSILEYYLFMREPQQVINRTDSLDWQNVEDMSRLRLRARAFFDDGRIEEAVETYRMILNNDPLDFESNVFVGNYYYLEGKRHLEHIAGVEEYSLEQALRYESYQVQKKAVIEEFFRPSIVLLNKAYTIAPNMVVKNTLDEIYMIVNGL